MGVTNHIGFDNDKYLKEQTEAILERVNRFNDKLYLEFGGKILYDYHAARVLPGFDPNVKMRLLQILKDKIDVILCIHAVAIELYDGTIITGKNSPLMNASSSLILNATKHLAGFPDKMYLLPENIIDSVAHLKKDILNGKMVSLDVDETLIVLGISALSNPAAKMVLENLTCDSEYSSKSLFISG
jgi:uncharacterized protein (UPF0371 family)